MNNIPKIFQSSVDPTQVSLTITSIGKAGAAFIVFLGMVGVVDPTIAGQAWGEFVAAIVTAIPAGVAVWHTGMALWGIVRKIGMRIMAMFATTPVTPATPPAQQ